mmetsp:Transcript_2330/g.2694  ORF Transcript_2330/g.2694 Transcript_2330/m.2694 type:complete len:207 (+) Transcript_2330:3-623(+)
MRLASPLSNTTHYREFFFFALTSKHEGQVWRGSSFPHACVAPVLWQDAASLQLAWQIGALHTGVLHPSHRRTNASQNTARAPRLAVIVVPTWTFVGGNRDLLLNGLRRLSVVRERTVVHFLPFFDGVAKGVDARLTAAFPAYYTVSRGSPSYIPIGWTASRTAGWARRCVRLRGHPSENHCWLLQYSETSLLHCHEKMAQRGPQFM